MGGRDHLGPPQIPQITPNLKKTVRTEFFHTSGTFFQKRPPPEKLLNIFIYTEDDTESDKRIKKTIHNTKHTNNTKIHLQKSKCSILFEHFQQFNFFIVIIYQTSTIHILSDASAT